ncbi:adhesion G-protein coupled receptor G7-like [Centropristis striata]|uniref:adhesion G-protein coupled receptor G7-like n=1 Tax=Centropristis striata TaxID=184440 RepID=UPI0027E10A98|nr:adhesion G-protein coupled receptor G7-like [Centropristis striata]
MTAAFRFTFTPYPTTIAFRTTTTTEYPTTTAFPTASTEYPTTTAFRTTAAVTFATDPPTITTHTTTTPTTISTTRNPPSTTPLICDNGGKPVSGVCICPDEWTGERCSVENFCRAQQLAGYSFPRTPIGWFAYSDELCKVGTSGAGKPRASTRCSTKNGPLSFEPPHVYLCDQTLSDIQQNLTSPAALETLASSTQILTSPNATEVVRVAAIATVSQLLNASVPGNCEENSATLELTKTLDQLSVDLSLSSNTSQSQVVQPNLVVQSAQIAAADTLGVQFTSLSGTSGSFVADRIVLNINTSTIMVENGISDALIYIRFPSAVGVHQQTENVSLGFVLYQNDRFFRSRRYSRRRVTVRVLSATIRGQERRTVPQHVEMQFRPRVLDGTALFHFACVFWDYSLQDWSTAGCSKGDASDGLLRCFCNHTTNFAALWSFRENYEYAEALDVISIVGLSFSVLGLVVTIIHHLKDNFQRKSDERETNKNSKLALLSICISLLAFILTFLSGAVNSSRQYASPVEVDNQTNTVLDSDEHMEPDGGSCTAVAALLHFFLLATFLWNFLYGMQLVLMVRMQPDTSSPGNLPPYWTPLSVTVGWGVPAIAMASTLGGSYSMDDPLGYRQEEFCWLAALDKNKQFDFGKPMFWGFLLPLALILFSNVVLLVLTSLTICSTRPSSLWKKFFTSFSLAVLLGLSWTMGYLVLVTKGSAHLVFSILFCVCTTTQGFQIFVLFTARTVSFRAFMSTCRQYVSSDNLPLRETENNIQAAQELGVQTTTGKEPHVPKCTGTKRSTV